MSGIYIPIEMPTGCAECPFEMYYFNTGETRCRATNKTLETNYCPTSYEERDLDCPLVPVPEHGDLIDKSGVEVLSWTEDPEKDFADGVLFVLDKLDELPVIIPADGEDYEVPADKGGDA